VGDLSELDRLLPLQGGCNFRDMGGYQTGDGRTVKRGTLFRSGSMGGLTSEDFAYLSGLGIRAVCDFRTTGERESDPNRWVEAAQIAYWTRDYEMSFGELRSVLAQKLATVDQARTAMIASYRRLPYEQAPAYRELFRRLGAGEVPLVFNCSAGKDRAGTAAALILSALGVPRETVIADYLLSNHSMVALHRAQARGRRGESPIADVSPEAVEAVLSADAAYLHGALGAVEEKHRSVAGYLDDELGVSAPMLEHIKALLLE
jgi:protein-tyrosine phosphatase